MAEGQGWPGGVLVTRMHLAAATLSPHPAAVAYRAGVHPPLAGRDAVLPFLKYVQDHRHDAIELAIDLVVPEAQHTVPGTLQMPVSRDVAFRVRVE